jgi:hypothetical protein
MGSSIKKLDDTPRVAAERFRKRFLKLQKKQFIKLLKVVFSRMTPEIFKAHIEIL